MTTQYSVTSLITQGEKMKKLRVLFIALIILATLSACTSNKPADTKSISEDQKIVEAYYDTLYGQRDIEVKQDFIDQYIAARTKNGLEARIKSFDEAVYNEYHQFEIVEGVQTVSDGRKVSVFLVHVTNITGEKREVMHIVAEEDGGPKMFTPITPEFMGGSHFEEYRKLFKEKQI